MRRRGLLGFAAAAALASIASGSIAQSRVRRVAVIARYLREPMTREQKADYVRGFEAHGFRPGDNLAISWHEMHFREGLAASLQKPGGNVTGVHNGPHEVAVKRVELLRAFVPNLKCVAWIGFGGQVGTYPPFEAAARAAGLRVRQVIMEVDDAPRFNALRKQLNGLQADGCVAGHLTTAIGEAIEAVTEVARDRKLALSYTGENARVKTDGLLFLYEARTRFFGRGYDERLAAIAARILRGERPGDIAFEGPLGYYLFLNARTASHLGLAIPPEVTLLADEVIR